MFIFFGLGFQRSSKEACGLLAKMSLTHLIYILDILNVIKEYDYIMAAKHSYKCLCSWDIHSQNDGWPVIMMLLSPALRYEIKSQVKLEKTRHEVVRIMELWDSVLIWALLGLCSSSLCWVLLLYTHKMCWNNSPLTFMLVEASLQRNNRTQQSMNQKIK